MLARAGGDEEATVGARRCEARVLSMVALCTDEAGRS